MENPVLRNHNSRQMLKIFRFIVTSYGASFMTDDLRETSKKVSKYRFRIPSNWVELGQVKFEKELSILPDNQPRSISKDLPYFLL